MSEKLDGLFKKDKLQKKEYLSGLFVKQDLEDEELYEDKIKNKVKGLFRNGYIEREEKEIKNNNEKNTNDLSDMEEKIVSLDKQIKEKENKIATLDKQIMNREQFIIDTELKHVDNMNGLEFEKYITELFIKLGYDAITTKASNDHGVDIIAEKDGNRYAIQCKNYSQPVGNKAVQEVYTSKGLTKSDVAIVLTNNTFTDSAIKEANILGIQLWDRDKLTTLLYTAFHFDFRNIDAEKLIQRIIYVKELDEEYDEIDDSIDPLLNDAIEFVIAIGQASTPFIQRKFRIGYARAGRIIDQMEARGIISGYAGSKPREVLITEEQWREINKK